MKNVKCWGIVHGNLEKNKFNNESVTIQYRCKSIKAFKDMCKKEGHKLTDKPYLSK